MSEAPEFISALSTAEVMGLDRGTVLRMIEDGTLPATRTRRTILIPRQALLDLLRLPRKDAPAV
jgi:excisionase family DNA binding protein